MSSPAVRSTLLVHRTRRRIMPTIDVNDTTLYYEREGSGPSVLFVHGQFGDADVWADQARRLSDRFSCVRYDRRGHSRSSPGHAAVTDSLHADDAAALIEALDLAPCLLVGSSRGAAIAIDVCLRHLLLLRGVVLSEPPLFSLDRDAGEALLGEVVPQVDEALSSGDLGSAVHAFFSAVCPSFWVALGEGQRVRYVGNAEIGLADLRSPPLQVSFADLAGIAIPALVITGETSHSSLRSIAHQVALALPNTRFVELENCGHVAYAEQPDEFADVLATFADELERQHQP
jgi:pimeloyl-ACP methyl ester carboxylesterase